MLPVTFHILKIFCGLILRVPFFVVAFLLLHQVFLSFLCDKMATVSCLNYSIEISYL